MRWAPVEPEPEPPSAGGAIAAAGVSGAGGNFNLKDPVRDAFGLRRFPCVLAHLVQVGARTRLQKKSCARTGPGWRLEVTCPPTNPPTHAPTYCCNLA